VVGAGPPPYSRFGVTIFNRHHLTTTTATVTTAKRSRMIIRWYRAVVYLIVERLRNKLNISSPSLTVFGPSRAQELRDSYKAALIRERNHAAKKEKKQ
jgi:hypothetical protein